MSSRRSHVGCGCRLPRTWEIAIKTRLGRLDGEALLSAWPDIVADMTATDLPIDAADTIFAGA